VIAPTICLNGLVGCRLLGWMKGRTFYCGILKVREIKIVRACWLARYCDEGNESCGVREGLLLNQGQRLRLARCLSKYLVDGKPG
jgi:hypothetical protein